jgi:hypothetical protein
MTFSTRYENLADLVLIEIFSYLSSFDIIWGLVGLNQRINSLLVERRYFRDVNFSLARHCQFTEVVQMLPLNLIESLTIEINASPLQLSHWPYLPRLSTLRLKGIREYNDVIAFVQLHADTLTHLILETRVEFISVSNCYI